MKYLIPIVLLVFFVSCDKEDVIDDAAFVGDTLFDVPFESSSAHTTTGSVIVKDNNGQKKIQLSNFKTDGGPDLRIVLAEDLKAKGSIELRKGAPSGTYALDIPSGTDLAKKKYVLVWCQSFSVLFGSAELK